MATILVADDNSNIQKMVTLALKGEGIEVVAVSNGEAAVRKLPDVRPDLVLADVFMPVRNGYEVCEFVKNDARFSQIPVILLVGAFDPLDEREAERVGADGVLKKPFVPPEPLIHMVKSALARSASETPQPVPVAVGVAVEPSAATVPLISGIELLARAPAPAEAEEETPEAFVAPPQRIEFSEDESPLAFGDLLETPAEEAEPAVGTLRGSALGEMKIWDRAATQDALEAEPQPLAWCESEPALPRRDEADFFQPTTFDADEPSATISAEAPDALIQPGPQPNSELHVESGSPPELASTPDEWMESAAANPPAPLPADAKAPWTYAGPPEAETLPAEPVLPAAPESERETAPVAERSADATAVAPSAGSGVEEDAGEEAAPSTPETGGWAEATEQFPVPADSPRWSTPLAPVPAKPEPAPPASSATVEVAPAAPEASVPGAGAHSYEAPPAADPQFVEAVVARVIERMQPQILEIVTREILRPVVEALVRRELEKS